MVMLETGFSATVDLSKTHTSYARQVQLSFPAKAAPSASLLSTEGSFRALHAGRCQRAGMSLLRCLAAGGAQGPVRALPRGHQPPAPALNRCDAHQGRSQPLLITPSVSLQRLCHRAGDPCFVSARCLCQASLSERRRRAGSSFWWLGFDDRGCRR